MHQEADEALEAETEMLNRATLGLHQAREEHPLREESTPGKMQGSVGTSREMTTPPVEVHVNTQGGSVGKGSQQTRRNIMDVLPKDLTHEQVETVKKAVKAAVTNGFVFDMVERKRLLDCEFTERFR